ncbi:MAG TPA: PDR/VanB family oxidoreductase [Pseudonocardia sp.]|nr:PDR/VanB family oxidoreductase [Pseudonocardia sp.]
MTDNDTIPRPSGLMRAMGWGIALTRRLGSPAGRPPVMAVDRDLRLRIDEIRAEARDVVSLRLVPADGRPLPAWQPGAHLDLVLPSGCQRQYSLCGDPGDPDSYRLAVRRIADGGGGSREVHELVPGTELVVKGPRPAFPLVRAPSYLFMAGGIGITPILPMVRAVAASDADWRLVYAGRDRDLMPFLGELAELDAARVTVWSDRERGRPPTGVELLAQSPEPGTSVGYLCGPPAMVGGARAALDGTAGAPGGGMISALHVERFSAPPVVGGRQFVVELASDGSRYVVPGDRSLLQVLRERRVGVPYSCQQGFCGTCRTRVLAGQVEHHDRALTETDRAEHMAICVSRSRGETLVLDL